MCTHSYTCILPLLTSCSLSLSFFSSKNFNLFGGFVQEESANMISYTWHTEEDFKYKKISYTWRTQKKPSSTKKKWCGMFNKMDYM